MTQSAQKNFSPQMTVVDAQSLLPLKEVELPADLLKIAQIHDLHDAILKTVSWCEDFNDWQDLADPLGIDHGQMSRIKKGSAHFPENKLLRLMQLCGNAAPVWWLLYKLGFDITSVKRTQNDYEKRIDALNEQLHEKEQEVQALRRALRG